MLATWTPGGDGGVDRAEGKLPSPGRTRPECSAEVRRATGRTAQPRMTPIPDVASPTDISRTERASPATPTIDSAQATQYVADSKMNMQDGQHGRLHSRHVTW